jgi:hypothetical protein
MKRILLGAVLLSLIALQTGNSVADPQKQNWTHFVRIGAWGLQPGNAERIVREATDSQVLGIEVDNDIPGRYESFLSPAEKLKAIHDVADAAHRAGNHAFVYIAGTECITANADKTPHTIAKDHPDWLQRKITGEPAIFGGGTAFWIRKGDEDVWISPYAAEWRKIYMERVRQIAATGIDGIYVDIPYWMTHFEGWEDTWASFDDYTVAAFKKQTGLDAKKDLKLGSFSDPNFRRWIEFRIQTFTDFMAEIDRTAKSVNPEIKTIPEIYPGIEEEAVRVGADVYSLYPVVDVIAHEYEFGGGNHMASARTPLFAWIAKHQDTLFHPRKPIHPVGVYFSPTTRNFFTNEFIPSYQGVLILLMQKHLEYQIVTPRTLPGFKGETLVFPDVRIVGDEERSRLWAFVDRGGKLIITGHDATELPVSSGVVRLPDCPGRAYLTALSRDFNGTSPLAAQKFLMSLQTISGLTVEALPSVATQIANVDGLPHVFFANFTGLVGGENPVPSPESHARIVAAGSAQGYFLPFMGEIEELQGKAEGGETIFALPAINRGAVVWLRANESSAHAAPD